MRERDDSRMTNPQVSLWLRQLSRWECHSWRGADFRRKDGFCLGNVESKVPVEHPNKEVNHEAKYSLPFDCSYMESLSLIFYRLLNFCATFLN